MRVLSGFAVLLTLAACGGGGGPFVPGPPAFTAIVNQYNGMEAAAGSALVVTDVSGAAIPTPSDPANYSGFIVFNTEPRDPVTGVDNPGQAHFSRMNVQANFSSGTISGNANQFYYYDEVAGGPQATSVGGDITISGGPPIILDTFATPGVEGTPITVSGQLDIAGNGLVDVASSSPTLASNFFGDDNGSGQAANYRYFSAQGDTDFVNGDTIPTRIITELQ